MLSLALIVLNHAVACTIACGVDSGFESVDTLPTDGGVSLSWLRTGTDLEFRSPQGDTVLIDVTREGFVNGAVFLFEPEYELEPDTTYRMLQGDPEAVIAEFHTGDGPGPFDVDPVDIVDLQRDRGPGGNTCPRWTSLDVTFSDAAPVGGYLELQASEDASFDVAQAYVIGSNSVYFGCGHNLERGTSYLWRVRAVNAAGLASEWSEPIRYRTATHCGCQVAPSGAWWGMWVPLALFARRRRG